MPELALQRCTAHHCQQHLETQHQATNFTDLTGPVFNVYAGRRGPHAGEGEEGSPVRVADMLTKFLREHQRDGLQFLFDCVTGRKAKEFDGLGW